MIQGRRGWSRLVALLGLVALLVTACSNTVSGAPVPVVIPPPSAAESIAQSLLNLGEAGAVHYKGTFTSASDEKITFDVTVSSAGDVLGSITADGNPATILMINKSLFVKAPAAFWAALRGIGEGDGKGTAIADRWVKLPSVLLGVEFGDMFTPDGLSQDLAKEPKTAGEGALAERPKTTESGVEVIKIPVESGAIFLAAQPPYGLARLTLSRLGATDNTRVKDLVADVADTSADTVKFYQELANQAAGLNTAVDALTTVNQGPHRFDQCGASSCSLIVEFTNTAKVPVRVHVKADWTGDNAPLGSCETEVGPVAPGQPSSATCTLSSPEWVNFWQRAHSVVGTHPYGASWAPLVLADAPDLGSVTTQASAKPADPKNRKTEGSHYVYTVKYADKVWKYGVAGTKYWQDHAKAQLRPCLAVNQALCTFSLVTATDNAASAYALQQQLVAGNPGGCPPGQWVSCKR
ncbi:MAG TPA: hypothetical protein VGR06_14200 [Actinophytocola sp.]|uniref:hypothetical protein n=1 Tax=Actinophytocola sp. TaxID=1872138 RepID=UPI002DF773D8|nr:hypothetical protein [Actinophytocola sp.]